jgi:hypothetical protein
VRVHQKNVTLNEKTIVLNVVCSPKRLNYIKVM